MSDKTKFWVTNVLALVCLVLYALPRVVTSMAALEQTFDALIASLSTAGLLGAYSSLADKLLPPKGGA